MTDTTLEALKRYVSPVLHLPYRIILASGSPRRLELLSTLISSFSVETSDVDEDPLTTSDPWETAEKLAWAKAHSVSERFPDALVIGGDTVVALPLQDRSGPFEQLAKPKSVEDARRMLAQLSGREHAVITGVALISPADSEVFHETTWVRFRRLTAEEIESYASTGEPMDKAGAYALQGGASQFVETIDGSRSNVIGLPLERTEQVLRSLSDAR